MDGLRAISICLVIVSHAAMALGADTSRVVHRYVDWGALGVRVFFVISGYLITRLLLEERDRSGSINLGRFYFRRTLRIFPPFYLYLAVVVAFAAAGLISQSLAGVAAAATYTANYAHDAGWYVGHSWSLAVEEQFYLLWPAAVVFLGVRARWAAWAVVFACPVLRWWTYTQSHGSYGFDHHFETTADFLAVGCLLASYEGEAKRRLSELRLPPSLVLLTLAAVVLCASTLGGHPRIDLVVGRTTMAFAITGLVLTGVHAPHAAVARALNWAPLMWVGRISYSLYLWQQLAFGPVDHPDGGGVLMRLVAAFVLALASYHLIEQPIARRRNQVESTLRALISRARNRPVKAWRDA